MWGLGVVTTKLGDWVSGHGCCAMRWHVISFFLTSFVGLLFRVSCRLTWHVACWAICTWRRGRCTIITHPGTRHRCDYPCHRQTVGMPVAVPAAGAELPQRLCLCLCPCTRLRLRRQRQLAFGALAVWKAGAGASSSGMLQLRAQSCAPGHRGGFLHVLAYYWIEVTSQE